MSEALGSGRVSRANGGAGRQPQGLRQWLRNLFRLRNGEPSLRETIEEIIEEIGENGSEEEATVPIGDDERMMLANILKLRHLTAYDVMVPRADIVALEADTDLEEVIRVMRERDHSRVPLYRESLDDVIGMVHIKDVLPHAGHQGPFSLARISRQVLFVAPSMRVIELLLEMRRSRIHLALVVDEFGGIDGLITIEDLVEEIVGEIQDEHDVAEGPKLIRQPDGSLIADARCPIEEFEAAVGPVLTDAERDEDIDTLGGFVFSLTGRVPARGELITHEPSGVSFEVIEADPRRIKRLRLRNLPQPALLDSA